MPSVSPPLFLDAAVVLTNVTDSGAEKKELCLRLGAEVWIDFKETQDIVAAVKAATGGAGAHSAVVTTASVSIVFTL